MKEAILGERTLLIGLFIVYFAQNAFAFKLVKTLGGYTSPVYSLAFSSDGKYLAGGSYDEIRVWDMKTLSLYKVVARHKDGNYEALSFSPDGKYFAAAECEKMSIKMKKTGAQSVCEESLIKIWEIKDFNLLKTFSSAHLSSIFFSPDGNLLFTIASEYKDDTGWSTDVRVWDLKNIENIQMLRDRRVSGAVASAMLTKNGEFLMLGKEGWVVVLKVDDLSTYKSFGEEFVDFFARFDALSLSPDGRLFAVALWPKPDVLIGDIKNFSILKQLELEDVVSGLSFSSDGKYIAGVSFNKVRVWETGKFCNVQVLPTLTKFFDLFPYPTSKLSFSPKGNFLAVAGGGWMKSENVMEDNLQHNQYGEIEMWSI